jgi:hypothetical protein
VPTPVIGQTSFLDPGARKERPPRGGLSKFNQLLA